MFKRITTIVLCLTIAMEATESKQQKWNNRGLEYPPVLLVPTKEDIVNERKAKLKQIEHQIAAEVLKNDPSDESLRRQIALAKEERKVLQTIRAALGTNINTNKSTGI